MTLLPLAFSPATSRVAIRADEQKYIDRLLEVAHDIDYAQPECSVALPYDNEIIRQSRDLYQKLSGSHRLKHVVVVGIGGSNLGTLAVYDALYGLDDLYGRSDHRPRLYSLDTTHDATTQYIGDYLLANTSHLDEIVVCIVSKSGNTTETMANANILIQKLETKFGSISGRIVAITDLASAFYDHATTHAYHVLTLPKQVGGRYSVFSAVGIFPLVCLGVDVDGLVHGAQAAVADMKSPTSVAHGSYVDLARAQDAGLAIHDLFLFDPRLETLGKWYRQLLAESLGKEGKGLLPTVSIGSTDLHSVAQLYLGGPNNRFTTFVWVTQETNCVVAQKPTIGLVGNLGGKNLSTIHRAIYEGTCEAYTKMGRLYNAFHLSTLSTESVGAWMQTAMLWTMMLGRHMEVNAFDQPQVEVYKTVTRSLLQKT